MAGVSSARTQEEVFGRSDLCQLAFGLPGASERVTVASMQLAFDVPSDANTGRCGAGVGTGAGQLRAHVVVAVCVFAVCNV